MPLKTLAIIVWMIACQNLSAQRVLINGTEGDRLLQWADFKGTPDNSSPYFAYTAWKTSVRFSGVKFEGTKAIIDGFEMTVEFDAKSSWVKKGKETDELLKHEQGHFDVGLLYMQEVLRTIGAANFTRTGYKEEFQNFVEAIHRKYAAISEQYDKETNHSIKKDEQAKWNTYFAERVVRPSL